MIIDGEKDIQGLKEIGQIVGNTLAEMKKRAEPGMTTAQLDEVGKEYLEKQGALSAPQSEYDFPGVTCICVNEEIAHGIPGDRVLQEGDLINIDVSASKNSYFADAGGSFALPPVDHEVQKLCRATYRALRRAMSSVRAGKYLWEVGKAVENVARKEGYKIIRNLGSHGVGRSLHEPPEFIPSYVDRKDRRKFEEGMVITLEPFLSTGAELAKEDDSGWTLKGPKGNFTAQYEHTMIITRGKPIAVTELEGREEHWFE